QSDKDSVKQAFLNHQQNTDFKQTENLSYDIPINKLPFLDFVTANARYTANYEWMHAPFAQPDLGATIQNSNTQQINGQLNMTMLYNKIPFFKRYLQEQQKVGGGPPKTMPGKGGPLNKQNKQAMTQHAIDSMQRANDTTKTPIYYTQKWFARLVTSVKNISFTYSQNQGMVLPGYSYSTRFFGMDNVNNWVPGPTFVFGGGQKQVNGYTLPQSPLQKYTVPEFVTQAIANNWLDTTSSIYTPFTTVLTKTFSIHATLEPVPDLKIDLTATHTQSKTTSEYIHDSIPVNSTQRFTVIDGYTEAGNFSMSYFMLGTILKGNTAADLNLFYQYLDNRAVISQRLGRQFGTQALPG
ncbi:MAG TPA: hypothetical protein VN922_10885, partial [Bacteroidia bacterium]|nr:hypothetical protein [Bacteroidia bacterium]